MTTAENSIDRAWSLYKTNRSTEARDELIVAFAPLVKYVAGRVSVGLPPNVEQADLVSYGMFGLIDAIEKFQLERGFKFETYAIPRIRGAIVDELRSMDWVPRSIRAKASAVQRAIATLEAELQRSPTEREIADELEMTVDELNRLLAKVSLGGIAALDQMLAGNDSNEPTTVGDMVSSNEPGPDAVVELDEIRRQLAGSIGQLPEREKTVLSLYYYEGLTLAAIGEVIGVTESRVCQIHAKSLLQLRSRLAD